MLIPKQLSTVIPNTPFIWWSRGGWRLYNKVRQEGKIALCSTIQGGERLIPAHHWVAVPDNNRSKELNHFILEGLFANSSQLTYLKLRVLTGSMEPALPQGGIVYLRPPTALPPKTGSIITIAKKNIWLTHRLLYLTPTGQLLTKGDAIPHLDQPSSQSQLFGTVEKVEYNGKIYTPSSLLPELKAKLLALKHTTKSVLSYPLKWRESEASRRE